MKEKTKSRNYFNEKKAMIKILDLQKHLEISFELMRIIDTHNLVISSIDEGDRRKIVNEFFEANKYKPYRNESEDYDYVVVDILKSPGDIYNIYQKHNGKTVIFDTEKLFSRKQYFEAAYGGFCSSPDSGRKWSVSVNGRKDFIFHGHVIIKTILSKNELLHKDKFYMIVRDMHII